MDNKEKEELLDIKNNICRCTMQVNSILLYREDNASDEYRRLTCLSDEMRNLVNDINKILYR